MALLTRIASHRGYPADELVFVRMAVGAAGCLALWRAGQGSLRVTRPGLLLVRGLLGTAAILLFFFAIGRLPVGIATLLNYTSPLFTALFAILFLGERPGPRPLFGLAATFLGLALVVGWPAGGSRLGVAAGLLSGVLSGGAITSVRALRRTEPPLPIFLGFSLIAILVSGPLAGPHARLPRGLDLPLVLGIGLCSLAAQLLFTDAMGHVSAVAGAVVSPLTPLFAFALGALLLGEPLSPRILAGSLLALLGVGYGSSGVETSDPAPAVAAG